MRMINSNRYLLLISTITLGLLTGFMNGWMYSSTNSLCYGGGKAYRCVPDFLIVTKDLLPDQNVSTCGQYRKQRICNEPDDCHSCMKETHDAKYLTDQNVNNKITYWASGYVKPGESITFSYSFNKIFEIYYISLVFLNLHEPDSIVIEKSLDYGNKWTVWHYFSKDCVQSFGLKPSAPRGYYSDDPNSQTRNKCSPLTIDSTINQKNIVAAFTTISDARVFSSNSDAHLDYMSASNIRITLKRFKTSVLNFGFTFPPILKKYLENMHKSDNRTNDLLQKPQQNPGVVRGRKTRERDVPSVLGAGEYFAISDISVGGRCQCYGHAGKCIRDPVTKKYTCDCQHNTAGRDCEKCRKGFTDIPWTAATRKSATECKRCKCNLHSQQCEFNKDLFTIHNYKSGGKCVKCEHNTAGNNCQHCKKGYSRDWSKPLSHQFVCLKCRCHPIGSKFTGICNAKNSQCVCKPGVAGTSCNRCKHGYTQTTSPFKPCVKMYDPHRIAMAQPPENKCQQCNKRKKRVRFRKYCRRDAVMLVTLKSSEKHKKMVRFEMEINYVSRIKKSKFKKKQPDLYAAINSLTQHQTDDVLNHEVINNKVSENKYTFPLWLPQSDLDCDCPKLQLGVMYFVVLKLKTMEYMGRNELELNQKSVALKWQKSWGRRLLKFKKRQIKGDCKRFQKRRRRKNKKNKKQKYSP